MKLERKWWVLGAVAGGLFAPGACGPHVVEVGDLPQAGSAGTAGAAGTSGTGGTSAGGDEGQGGAPEPVIPECEFSWPPRGDEPYTDEARCTRNPDGNTGFMCPTGTGVSVTKSVGRAGATVSLSGTPSTLGSAVELTIPPNALSETVDITITETIVVTPSGFSDWSPLYYFSSSEPVSFATPAQIKMPSTKGNGVGDPLLSVYWSSEPDSCALAPLADSYVNAGFMQASVRFLGWGITGAPLPSE
jgi:hypothetical protein